MFIQLFRRERNATNTITRIGVMIAFLAKFCFYYWCKNTIKAQSKRDISVNIWCVLNPTVTLRPKHASSPNFILKWTHISLILSVIMLLLIIINGRTLYSLNQGQGIHKEIQSILNVLTPIFFLKYWSLYLKVQFTSN